MALSDAELKETISEGKKRKDKIDALRVAVLEGHMMVEESVEGFLEVALFNAAEAKVEEMRFRNKVQLAQAMSVRRNTDEFWAVVWALNQLRNKVAHEKDPKEIEDKMKFLRQAFMKTLTPSQAQDFNESEDKEIVETSSFLCMGLLAAITMDAKEWRATVKEHWEAGLG